MDINVQPQVPTFIRYEDYKKVVTQYELKCNLYNQQINEWINKHNALEQKYQCLLRSTNVLITKCESMDTELKELNISHKESISNLNDQYHSIRKLYVSKEQELKQIRREYRNIIPEILSTDNNRKSPSRFTIKKVLKQINIILFNHQKYYFHYDDIVDLFDDIIVSIPENTEKLRLPGCCCLTKYCQSERKKKRKRKKYDRDYCHEWSPKPPKKHKIDHNINVIHSVAPPLQPIERSMNINHNRSYNHDIYDNDDDGGISIPSPPTFDDIIGNEKEENDDKGEEIENKENCINDMENDNDNDDDIDLVLTPP